MTRIHRVGSTDDLKDGDAATINIGSKVIAVFRIGDQFHAIDDMCPHMGASLSGGPVDDGIVTCPWHYWRFSLIDGSWADNPRIKVGCYKVQVIGDEVYVEVPDPPPPSQSETCFI